MTYLIAAAQENDLTRVRAEKPELWRQVRRYNKPVQLALAAAEEVMRSSLDPSTAAVISLAPCQPGSADLYSWGNVVTSGMATRTIGNLRMNPTQTLHAVDNLAMSAFAIAHRNHAYCLGLGGAAGQAWCGLEAVHERLNAGLEEEALLMAGDQDAAEDAAPGLGVALLFSVRARPYLPLDAFSATAFDFATYRTNVTGCTALCKRSCCIPVGNSSVLRFSRALCCSSRSIRTGFLV